jgi:putative phosphoesterase
MRVAALYDIHGNLPALEAIVRDVRQADVDRIVIGGDVLPGPMPRETIGYLQGLDLSVQYIRGNGDREVLAHMRGAGTESLPEQIREMLRWCAQRLQPRDEILLDGWPASLQMQIPGVGEVLFCHATPRNDTEIFTRLTSEDRLRPVLAGLKVNLVVCGHTHMQFDRTIGSIRVVNAGSVGMPFGEPGAYWLLLDRDVQLRRTDYDLATAAERIRRTNYPQAQDFAARHVLHPPSEAEMLQVFAGVELK